MFKTSTTQGFNNNNIPFMDLNKSTPSKSKQHLQEHTLIREFHKGFRTHYSTKLVTIQVFKYSQRHIHIRMKSKQQEV